MVPLIDPFEGDDAGDDEAAGTDADAGPVDEVADEVVAADAEEPRRGRGREPVLNPFAT